MTGYEAFSGNRIDGAFWCGCCADGRAAEYPLDIGRGYQPAAVDVRGWDGVHATPGPLGQGRDDLYAGLCDGGRLCTQPQQHHHGHVSRQHRHPQHAHGTALRLP